MNSCLPPDNRGIEWPTLLLAVLIYGGWLAVTWFNAHLPLWVIAPVGAWLIAWHSSLQHEIIHGHPTPYHRLNTLIAALPIGLWLPYACYRRDHRAHHAAKTVTDPFEDPESRYLPAGSGSPRGIRWLLATWQAPLVGRLVIGPIDTVARFLTGEAQRLRRAPAPVVRDWVPHMLGLAVVGGWLWLCDFSPVVYLIGIVYPGLSLSLLRSFAEHRAAEQPGHRVAVVERGGPFSLLFLNNNLHAAHHRAPGVPWYRLPAYYRSNRREILTDNGQLHYRSYGEIVRRYAWRAHDTIHHPYLS